jgi:lycopene cyclase domain-containing protein
MLTYLLVNLGALSLPLLFSFHRALRFYLNWKALWPAMLLSALFFISWDIYFTGLGVWGFDDRYILGIRFFNLPLEEYLFFICIPYATLFSYHCMTVIVNECVLKRQGRLFAFILAIILLGIGMWNYDKLYTAFISITVSVLLLVQVFVLRSIKMNRYLITLAFLMVPFIITNGILTGAWLNRPVFWYNSETILALRIFTIPIEDLFYTMLLLLVNVTLYEYFLSRNNKAIHASG